MTSLREIGNRVLSFVRGERPPEPEQDTLSIYMHPMEFAQMTAVVETLQPRLVLEWGSGGSTKALLEQSPFIERFVSVEHNTAWFERVKQLVVDPRLELHLRPATEPEPVLPRGTPGAREILNEWKLRCEIEPELVRDYIDLPRSFGLTFDLAIVDGRARTHCLREAWRLVRPGGMIVLHDAQREEYHSTLQELGRHVFIEPWEQGQICLLPRPAA